MRKEKEKNMYQNKFTMMSVTIRKCKYGPIKNKEVCTALQVHCCWNSVAIARIEFPVGRKALFQLVEAQTSTLGQGGAYSGEQSWKWASFVLFITL